MVAKDPLISCISMQTCTAMRKIPPSAALIRPAMASRASQLPACVRVGPEATRSPERMSGCTGARSEGMAASARATASQPTAADSIRPASNRAGAVSGAAPAPSSHSAPRPSTAMVV